MYSQKDLRWRWTQLGNCKGSTIGSSGCLLTVMAQLLTNHGIKINPGELNKKLLITGNYRDGCLIPDNAIEKLYPDQVKYLGRKTSLTHMFCEPGEEVILKVDSSKSAGIQRHFVLLKYIVNGKAIIADPLGGRVGDLNKWYGNPLAIIKYRFKGV